MGYKWIIIFKFIIMNINHINKLFYSTLFHKILLIILIPILILFGIINIFYPVNIFFIIIGSFIIYIGNKCYQKSQDYIYLFELLLVGPLMIMLGYTNNKYDYFKHISTVIGFCIIIYYFKNYVNKLFLLRR